MKVLLDHNVPHKLRTSLVSLSKHEIVTASYLEWGELSNGELLRRAEKEGFEVVVTGDQRLLSGRNLEVVALSINNWPIIKNYLAVILAAIDGAAPVRFRWSTAERLSARNLSAGSPTSCHKG